MEVPMQQVPILSLVTLIVMVLFHTLSEPTANAAGLRLTYSAGNEKQGEVVYTITPKITRMDRETTTLIINYPDQSLSWLDHNSNTYKQFGLKTRIDKDKDTLREQLEKRIASFQVSHKESRQQIKGYSCHLCQVRFASDLLVHRKVKVPPFKALGHNFGESSVRYWVTEEHPLNDQILDYAGHREALFMRNPLLRQLDPLGMAMNCGGLALRMEHLTARNRARLDLKTISTVGDDTSFAMIPAGYQLYQDKE